MRSTLLFVLAAAALAGCRDTTEPRRAPVLPLTLRVVPARTTVASGDTVTLRFSALNGTSQPVTLVGAEGCMLALYLRDVQGARHDTWMDGPLTCDIGPVQETIAPGDSLVEVHLWRVGVIVGGDVITHASPGPWTLHPLVFLSTGPLEGDPSVPATVTVVAR